MRAFFEYPVFTHTAPLRGLADDRGITHLSMAQIHDLSAFEQALLPASLRRCACGVSWTSPEIFRTGSKPRSRPVRCTRVPLWPLCHAHARSPLPTPAHCGPRSCWPDPRSLTALPMVAADPRWCRACSCNRINHFSSGSWMVTRFIAEACVCHSMRTRTFHPCQRSRSPLLSAL